MIKLVLEKAEEPEIKLPTSAGSSKKQESSRKASISALLTIPKPLTVWITINWKILQEMGIPDHLICLLRNLYAGQKATVIPAPSGIKGSFGGVLVISKLPSGRPRTIEPNRVKFQQLK